MTNEERQAVLAIPVVALAGAGIAWAGSQGGYALGKLPLFALCAALAFLIQWLTFLPAYLKQTEAFFDLTGSLTFLTVTAIALLLSPTRDLRAWLLFAIVAVWAVRLGTFLFLRIRRAGEDRRFRAIKKSFVRFLLTWTLQGLWVAFTLAPALAAITARVRLPLDAFALLGSILWLFGFAIEVTADRQKSRFQADPANRDGFIRTGLWSWSRHPNYFGEIVLWTGVAVIALPVLHGWQLLTLLSPIFVALLLIKISGIPMLEARADEKWGGQVDYEEYKQHTSILVPLPPQIFGD